MNSIQHQKNKRMLIDAFMAGSPEPTLGKKKNLDTCEPLL